MISGDLQKAAEVLVNVLLKTQKGETFVITADTAVDASVIEVIGRAAFAAGAKPLVALIPTPGGVSLAADPDIQVEGLSGMISKADVWVELNVKWLLYSTPFYNAKKANPKLRHMCLTGTNADTLIRCVGKVNYPAMRRFSEILREGSKRPITCGWSPRMEMRLPSSMCRTALFPANWAMPACREHICS